MQIMASLLRLQSEGIKDKHLLDLFNESQNRIKSMALIHEDLYQSKDFARIDFEQYTRTLTGRLISSYGVDPNRIIASVNIDNVFLDVDKAIPCGLILNELFTNSLKYAFPVDKFGANLKDKKGEIRIDCHSNSAEHTLVFSDNGVGFPENIDFHKTETLGLDLVKSLTRQLGGTIELNRNNGTEFTITFGV
jgi:two-component sensor histidine kinase